MNNEPLVIVENLSKKFCKDLKTSLWYGVKDLLSGVRGNVAERFLRPKEFWAVKDISFELRRGECLGLIGHNGAGKSTLLKILNGLINPDAGKVTMKGRVGALIELGAGFNPILTGRENIYNNGAILGFTKAEIDTKIGTIISFAELEAFIDMPIQHYSSGMKVRLGFAIAAQMEPDVLIIDEVLAVGDLGFVLKCFKTIDTILPHTAVIFVSHNMPMVSRICTHIILMEHGQSKFQGDDVAKAIDKYYMRFMNNESNVVYDDGSIRMEDIQLLDPITGEPTNQLHWGDDLKLNIKLALQDCLKSPLFTFQILDKEQRPVASFERYLLRNDFLAQDIFEITLTHKNLQLSKGIYSISIAIGKDGTREPVYKANSVFNFQVFHEEDTWAPFLLNATYK